MTHPMMAGLDTLCGEMYARWTGVQRRTGHHWASAGYDWALAASKPVLENLPTAPVQAGTWKQQDTLATSRVRSFHSRW